jgi:hypothetical protein
MSDRHVLPAGITAIVCSVHNQPNIISVGEMPLPDLRSRSGLHTPSSVLGILTKMSGDQLLLIGNLGSVIGLHSFGAWSLELVNRNWRLRMQGIVVSDGLLDQLLQRGPIFPSDPYVL